MSEPPAVASPTTKEDEIGLKQFSERAKQFEIEMRALKEFKKQFNELYETELKHQLKNARPTPQDTSIPQLEELIQNAANTRQVGSHSLRHLIPVLDYG